MDMERLFPLPKPLFSLLHLKIILICLPSYGPICIPRSRSCAHINSASQIRVAGLIGKMLLSQQSGVRVDLISISRCDNTGPSYDGTNQKRQTFDVYFNPLVDPSIHNEAEFSVQ